MLGGKGDFSFLSDFWMINMVPVVKDIIYFYVIFITDLIILGK